jgi:two-component system, NarL family, nitrate/nitrite response regulator NarL
MQVLICDDHPFMARALAMAMEQALGAEVTVVHRFADAAATAATLSDLRLCLVDFHIPGEDSAAGLGALRAAAPEARLLVFSGSEADADLRIALAAGAHGFLPKSASPDVIEAAVKLVLAGGRYLPERVEALAFGGAEPATAAPPRTDALTGRQRDVLGHVARGLSNKEIARELAISPATVKVHVAQIIGILEASNRTEAVANARRAGLI